MLFLFVLGCKPVATTLSEEPEVIPKRETELVAKQTKEVSIVPELSDRPNASYSEKTFQLGNKVVVVADYSKGPGLTFVNLHDDENTSILAAVSVIDSLGGQLIQLKHTGERNIEFRLGKEKFEFDPNRMFTDRGAEASLQRFSRQEKGAHKVIRSFADQLVTGLDTDVIFTLHNNSENNYSAESYLNEYKTDASDVYLNPRKDPDDFYFVTERLFFDALKDRGYNVVLQNNETATDDGSLSVLAARRKIPYINIEAQHGHLAEQIDMLLTIYELFE